VSGNAIEYVVFMCNTEQKRHGNKVADDPCKIDGFVPVGDYDAEFSFLAEPQQPVYRLELYASERPLAKQKKQDSFAACPSLNVLASVTP
jgi:hypothetical protein|tara:strand:+ start:24707 stop:24976 length:270 start_codon:yes stop_codon:yes gene_type:complete